MLHQLGTFQVYHDLSHFVALNKFVTVSECTLQASKLSVEGQNERFGLELATFALSGVIEGEGLAKRSS